MWVLILVPDTILITLASFATYFADTLQGAFSFSLSSDHYCSPFYFSCPYVLLPLWLAMMIVAFIRDFLLEKFTFLIPGNENIFKEKYIEEYIKKKREEKEMKTE